MIASERMSEALNPLLHDSMRPVERAKLGIANSRHRLCEYASNLHFEDNMGYEIEGPLEAIDDDGDGIADSVEIED